MPATRSIAYAFAALAFGPAASACGPLTGAAPRAPRPEAIADSIVEAAPLDRAHWGIEVVDAATGRTVYRHQPRKHFRPASNTKLVVTAVALDELGPGYRYRTPVYAPGLVPGDTVAESIRLVGRGDPTWSERFHPTDFAVLDALADSLALAGLRRVAGDVVIDASYFDSTLVNPTWEVGDLPWYYAAPVAAVGVGEGAFPVEISPGPAPGEPARLEILVPPEVAPPVVHRLVTDTAGADDDLDAAFVPRADTIVLEGTVPLDEEPDTAWLAVLDPALYAGRAFVHALELRGIEVEGGLRVHYGRPAEAESLAGADIRTGEEPRDGVEDTAEVPARRQTPPDERELPGEPVPIATWTSPPLTEIVAAILQPSQNWIAEHLLKTLGAELEGEGSWPAGIDVEERYLTDVVGIDSVAFSLRDGSGLSAQNLLTPESVVQLLAHARRQPWGGAYRRALASPALEESTLEERLLAVEGRLFAKTGTIAHVNALSGYMVTGSGRERIFSILTDASGLRSSVMRDAIDRIVRAFTDGGQR